MKKLQHNSALVYKQPVSIILNALKDYAVWMFIIFNGITSIWSRNFYGHRDDRDLNYTNKKMNKNDHTNDYNFQLDMLFFCTGEMTSLDERQFKEVLERKGYDISAPDLKHTVSRQFNEIMNRQSVKHSKDLDEMANFDDMDCVTT